MEGDDWKPGFWNDDIPTEKHYQELERNAAITAKDELAIAIAAYWYGSFIVLLIMLLVWLWW